MPTQTLCKNKTINAIFFAVFLSPIPCQAIFVDYIGYTFPIRHLNEIKNKTMYRSSQIDHKVYAGSAIVVSCRQLVM